MVAHGGRRDEVQKDFLEWGFGTYSSLLKHDMKKCSLVQTQQFLGEHKIINPYSLLGASSSDGCTPYSICYNGLNILEGIGQSRIKTIEKLVRVEVLSLSLTV